MNLVYGNTERHASLMISYDQRQPLSSGRWEPNESYAHLMGPRQQRMCGEENQFRVGPTLIDGNVVWENEKIRVAASARFRQVQVSISGILNASQNPSPQKTQIFTGDRQRLIDHLPDPSCQGLDRGW